MVCVGCKVELVIEKTGAECLDMFNIPPQPYQLWCADAYRCPGCGATILAGFANMPYSRNFEPSFYNFLESAKKAGQWFVRCFERVGDKDKPYHE